MRQFHPAFRNLSSSFRSQLQVQSCTQCSRCFASQSSGGGKTSEYDQTYGWTYRLAMYFPGLFCAALGMWQLDRREWKMDLLEERTLLLKKNPVQLFFLQEKPPEFYPVACTGVFDHDKAIYVGPRVKHINGSARKGWVLLTPMTHPTKNRTIIVNRGWVPDLWRHNAKYRSQNEPQGEVTIRALLRSSENPNSFVPRNKPDIREWWWIDQREIARHWKIPEEAPMVEVYSTEDNRVKGVGVMDPMHKPREYGGPITFPLEKSFRDYMDFDVMPETHLTYALFWFFIGGALLLTAWQAVTPNKTGSWRYLAKKAVTTPMQRF
eukprot:TRINITY_DN17683_c1_g3_i1.p1 TRINITY_DN17683_c1_g3~~TRINITY_DN17683_c1_g3_i1.p1  ORF type:complete len:333 (+),score=47.10 TRINITY_DN17683_c1_g3_i1:34-999(+)